MVGRARNVSWLCAAAFAATLCACPVFAAGPDDAAAQVDASRAEYERIARDMVVSKERLEALAADVATVKKDHASISAALIQSAKTEKKLGQDIEDITSRLDVFKDQEKGIRASLIARRNVLAEVLGALQRMGLNPPPALLVKPEDALSSVRSSILLGAVVPELRTETEILLADLKELSRVTASIEAERNKLSATIGEQEAEKQRLSLLLAEKQRLQVESETAIDLERKNSGDLANKAEDLKELIATLEAQAGAAEKKRLAEEERKKRETEIASLPVPEANQLIATPAFSLMQGQMALPVIGRLTRKFGADDGNGGVMHGDMVATQSGAIVTAPSDGSVLYAGPFRSYGQLLILNAGDGYHVVLAGMTRISVSLGQAVLAGEPVGAMGEARVADTASPKNGKFGPELYVEFRKDGKPVDPTPWWAERNSGRTGNDT